MSGYVSVSFDVKTDDGKLRSILGKLASTNALLEESKDMIVKEIKQNIEEKNIIDTGALLESIAGEVGDETAVIHDGVHYGFFNEFGTYKMAARPFFVPGLEKWGEFIGGKLARLFT